MDSMNINSNAGSKCRHRTVLPEVHLLILDGAPEAHDENVVMCPAAAIYADGNARRLQNCRERLRRELRSL